MKASSSQSARRSIHFGRILVWLVVVIAGLALVAYFAIGALAANALTQPRRDFSATVTPTQAGLDYAAVRFPARDGNAEIAGWFIPASDDAPVIIMVHGRDASRTAAVDGNFLQEAKLLHEAGFALLMIDLRGHGESSDARFTFGLKERYDVLGAVDWLQQQGLASGRIGVLGLSLGAAASIGAAVAEPAIAALVTDSAFADINTLIEQQWEAASGLPKPFLYAALLMARVLTDEDLTQAKPVQELAQMAPRPALLIHCAADDYIPAENLNTLLAAYPAAASWLIPGATCRHSEGFNVDPAAYSARVAAFFTETLGRRSGEQQ